jgi:hypothetical protein
MIDRIGGRGIVFENLQMDAGHFPDAIKDFQTSATARTLQTVRGIGYELQFVQHEFRHNQDAIQKLRFADIGDPPVDQNAGIQQLGILVGNAGRRLRLPPGCNIEIRGNGKQDCALRRTDHKSKVREGEKRDTLDEELRGFRCGSPRNDESSQKGGKYSEESACRATYN